MRRVKTLTTCYKHDWDADTNPVTYLPIQAGTEGMVVRQYTSNLKSPVIVVELDDGYELHLSPGALMEIE